MLIGETEYFQQRLDDQIDWYGKKSAANQSAFKRLRLIEILTAATIPVLAGFSQGSRPIALATGVAGMIVTVLAGILALYRFQENWREYRSTAEALKQEKYRYLARAKPYDNDQPFETLVERVEALLSSETTQWTEVMRVAQEAGKVQGERPAIAATEEKPI
jgi:hypothetical protein